MTTAQFIAQSDLYSEFYHYRLRQFRKECVTQKIVEIVKDVTGYYKFRYRDWTVGFLFGSTKIKHEVMNHYWDVIEIAERAIKELKDESNK